MAYDEELAQRIRSILEGVPGIVEKKMFGGVGYIVNGNMACGISANQLIVRMSQNDYAQALTRAHIHVFDMTGRPMKGWVLVDPEGYNGAGELKMWVERGLNFAQSLPPK